MRLRISIKPRESLSILFLGLAACAPASPARIPGDAAPIAGTAAAPTADPRGTAGVLVMAHGGNAEWNAAVEAAVAPLAEVVPTRIAFGMADPATLAEASAELAAAGVDRVAVVRLFLSGDSFRDATEYLLGERAEPPVWLARMHGEHAVEPIATGLRYRIDPEGLSDSALSGAILRERALSARGDGPPPAVLVLAHGAADQTENDALLRRIDRLAESVRASGRFGEVRAETLREDWPEARESAEARIRQWVEARNRAGQRVVVLPFRLFGFGPYASVLEGLAYEPAAAGLLPHPLVTEWLRARATATICRAGWTSSLPCETGVTDDRAGASRPSRGAPNRAARPSPARRGAGRGPAAAISARARTPT